MTTYKIVECDSVSSSCNFLFTIFFSFENFIYTHYQYCYGNEYSHGDGFRNRPCSLVCEFFDRYDVRRKMDLGQWCSCNIRILEKIIRVIIG